MLTFSAQTSDLNEAVGYELSVLEYLRAALLGQDESSGGGMILTLGDLTEDGQQRAQVSLRFAANISEGAVRAALNRFRPLAFSAAFKLQDMIAEWTLRANGISEWTFSKKLAGYDRLRAAGSLMEPSLFSNRPLLGRAFWELYRFFVPFRGSVVHSGGLALRGDGTIDVTKGNQTLHLTSPEQGSYVRSMCLVTKHLIGQLELNPFFEAILDSDFLSLEHYHGQTGFTVRFTRREALKVIVPSSHVLSSKPLSVRIDFDHLRRTMEKTYSGTGGRLYFSVEIFVASGEREATWDLPIEAVPSGVVMLQEGDANYDRFLRLTIA